jgi:hypothetical protein
MPDARAPDEVYCPDCGLQWVADEGVHTRGCRHLDLAKRPSEMDDDELLRLALWLADGGERRLALWLADVDPIRARASRDYESCVACWAGSSMTARTCTSLSSSAPGPTARDRD